MGIVVGGGNNHGGMDEINVTPLIDVVLVLLIIFMVLTPMTVQKMSNSLPPEDEEETPPPPDTPPDQLMIAIYKEGEIALNLKEGTDDELMKELGQRLLAKEKKIVFIDAHPDANYARVIRVMDLVRGTVMKEDPDTGKMVSQVKVGLAELKDEGPARLLPGQALPTAPSATTAAGTPPG